MIIEFFVNGKLVDMYRCVSTPEQLAADQLCAEDKAEIALRKQQAFRTYGIPVVTVNIPARSNDDDLAPGAETL